MSPRSADHAAAERQSVLPSPVRLASRLLASVGWTVLGLIAWFISVGTLGGYPQVHSALLTTLGMIAIALTGGITWIVDERRPHDDE
ncbi:hypothetical protein ABT009_44850 [Streptomyces sp. NPDC002896]|uniref:hypothetical protein n=1 Tax=Streptomyces sp. NPDC002896 TaxID=3154438 RepID=UPI00332C023A